MRRAIPVIILLCLVGASCSDDSPLAPSTSAPTTATTATTTAPQETTPPETSPPATQATTTTPTTQPPTTAPPLQYVFVVSAAGIVERPPKFGTPTDPEGSGCVPGSDVLPDGIWFGFAQAVAGGTITFDLACYFSGDAAITAGAADGWEVEDGFYIRNQNPRVFTVPIAGAAEAWSIDGSPGATDWFAQQIPLASWPSATSWLPCPSADCAVWLYVNGGAATGIVEEFLP